ncbi:MAG: hypothetical protein JJ899_11055 [Alphaproteobacteria bacterium]|nr:hypothetical protein [Alphaproteobacteria bacterium]
MAKKKNAKVDAKANSGGAARRGGAGNTYLITVVSFVVVLLAIFAAPALLVFAVGMVPSLVAWMIDRTPGHNVTVTVAAMNFTGVAPFVAELLIAGATMVRATAMVTDVFVLALMYGAAAAGWVLLTAMPKVASVYISVRNEARVQVMQRERKRIVEEWGPDVRDAPAARKPAGPKRSKERLEPV